MKKTIFFAIIAMVFLASCSEKYVMDARMSNSFDKSGTYKLALMPVQIENVAGVDHKSFANRAYNQTTLQITGAGNVNVIGKSSVQSAVNKYAFGGQKTVNFKTAKKVANEVGADLIAYCTISKEQADGPLLAEIHIYDLNELTIYHGKARSINPVSDEGSMDFAIEKAMEKFVKEMKK